ncbi:response regulator transcription factor [Williamsia sp. CHRR-6]|uniref:response regulator transcription factor n=1 Tax=Williamsia sp. CHRR-6 TaxID=2835871 RepID=UPI001BDA781A|nr:response regulator transcription factor [Williamsia sp. CHRR-6]MBT0567685.1 response regulator transcription factor [Williamsia sp. CHRR-6]
MSEPIRVVIADDQTTIREALAMMLDLNEDLSVVGTAENGSLLVDLVETATPDVVLTDLRMPVLDGADATRAILERHPELPVVVLTTFDDDESIFRALDAGACGYLTKDANRHELAAAIRAAAAGQSVLDRSVQQRLMRRAAGSTPAPAPGAAGASGSPELAQLTTREREVLVHMAAGSSNRENAAALFISESTVKTHINNVFAKLALRDRAQAIAFAHRHGLAPDQ